WLILAFLVPMVGMWVGFACCGVHPFGDKQMLYSDLREQYYPFLQEFHARLQNGESILWSWNGGMGTDFGSLIAYYVASPLNFLTLFFPSHMLRDVMTFLLTVRIGCAGLFFALMLKKIFGKNNFSITFFGWMFAFCSFIMGYYWDTIWMDTVAILPLVFLGLYQLVTEGKFQLYVISLFWAVLSNYYLGAFVCYFCVIAFFAIAAIRQVYGKPFLGRLLQFAGTSLLGGGLTAFLLLHAGYALQYTDSASSGGVGNPEFYDSFTGVVGNLFAFNSPTAMEGLPNLYCGVLPLLLSVLFLRSKKIRPEDKIINISFLAFFIFSTNFNVLDFILHGLRFPNMLPARYSFLICFVLLLVGYRGFLLLKDFTAKDLFFMAGLAVILLGFSSISLGTAKFLGNVILVAAYLLFFFLYERKLLKPKVFTVFLCLLISAELVASLVLSMDKVKKTSYTSYPYRQDVITETFDRLEEDDPTFWRGEMTCRYYLNDGVMYRYRGIGQFSSTANRNVRDLMSSMAFTTGANSYYYNFSSPVNNSLLGLKYLVSRSGELMNGTETEIISAENNLHVYRNTAYLGAGFMTEPNLSELEFTNSPFQVQNRLFQHLTGSDDSIFFSRQEDSFESYDFESLEKTGSGTYQYTTNQNDGTLNITYTAASTGTYYAYMKVGGGGDIMVTTESGKVYSHPVASLRYITPLCEVEAGESFTVQITADSEKENKIISIYCYYFNEQNFDEGWANLSDEVWNVTEVSDTRLKGDITVKEDGLFCTVIPYTNGWKLYVDGVETETVALLNGAYIGANLTEGTHTVELKYTPEWFVPGIAISAGCLVVFVLLCILFPKGFPTFREPIRK
ncbi:MAG: YfhO family protein, partial [Clostridia bacterium]|nr:YfhO family protein [Clostridia bacterium]